MITYTAQNIRLFLCWIFDKFTSLGFEGIAWAYVFAPLASGLAALIFYLSGRWKKPRVTLKQ